MVTCPGAAQDEPPGAVFLSSSTNDSRLSQCAVRRWLYDRFVRNFRNFLNSGFTATLWALIKKVLAVAPKSGPLSSTSAGVWKEFTMPQAKQTSKRKRRSKALP